MKVLLVTAQLAMRLVKDNAEKSLVESDVLALPMPVAALLNSRYIAKELESRSVRGYDLILVPGMVFGDVSIIEKTTGIPTFKGPRYAADLPTVLGSLDKVQLSKTIPACEILKDRLRGSVIEDLKKVEDEKENLLSYAGNILIGSLAVGKDFPIRIMAEIDDVPMKSDEKISRVAQSFLNCGADMIDIGMVAGESHPDDVRRAIKIVRHITEKPISIDTLDLAEAESGIRSGADMLLSVDASNINEVVKFASEAAITVIPTDHKKGVYPKNAEDRVRMLEENVGKAVEYGLCKVVGDPILDAVNLPGLTESLVSYYQFRAKNKSLPLLMGVANVTELIDADSVGVNALLAGIASELGVSILLTTEVSDKTKGSVTELSTASKMMYLAKKRSSVPKDLGIDLLKIKEKRFREEPYRKTLEECRGVVIAERKENNIIFDPKGCFKIMVDREDQEIVAIHYMQNRKETEVLIKGNTASEIVQTAITLNLVSKLDHVAYLGAELKKAEIALKIGRSYVQDYPLFD